MQCKAYSKLEPVSLALVKKMGRRWEETIEIFYMEV